MSSSQQAIFNAINSVLRKTSGFVGRLSPTISKPHKKKRNAKKRKRRNAEDPVKYTIEHEIRLAACVNLLKNREIVNLRLSDHILSLIREGRYEDILNRPLRAYEGQNLIEDPKNRAEPVILLAIANCFNTLHRKGTLNFTSFNVAEGILRECDVFIHRWFVVLLHMFLQALPKMPFLPAIHEGGLVLADAFSDMIHSCLTNNIREFNHEIFHFSVRDDPSGPLPIIIPDYYEQTLTLALKLFTFMARKEAYWNFLNQPRLTAMLSILITHPNVSDTNFEAILRYAATNEEFLARAERILDSGQVIHYFLELIEESSEMNRSQDRNEGNAENGRKNTKVKGEQLKIMLDILHGYAKHTDLESEGVKKMIELIHRLLLKDGTDELKTSLCEIATTNIVRFGELACPSHQAAGAVVELMSSESKKLKEAASEAVEKLSERWNMEHFQEKIKKYSRE